MQAQLKQEERRGARAYIPWPILVKRLDVLRQYARRPALKVQRSADSRLVGLDTPTPSPRLWSVLLITGRNPHAIGRECLSNHAALGRPVCQRIACQSFQGCLRHPDRQHGRSVRTFGAQHGRRLLRCRDTRYAQHVLRRRQRSWPGALQALQRPALPSTRPGVLVPAVLGAGVLTLDVLRLAFGSHPRLRNSETKAATSAPALPLGIRPEKLISP
jgi:hypothetical protein